MQYDKTNIDNAFKSQVGFYEIDNIQLGRQTSGLLIVGKSYKITNFKTGDNFLNVGASANVNGEIFIATGTTPTSWTNDSELQDLQLVTSNSGYFVNDLNINLQDIKDSLQLNDNFVEYESVTDYLLRIYESSVISLLNNFIAKSKQLLNSNSFIKNQNVFNSFDYNLVNQSGNFNGFLVKNVNANDLKISINKLLIQLNEVDNFDIYIYDLQKTAPLHVINVDYTDSFDLLEQLSNIILNANNKAYLIGFYEYNSANPQNTQLNETNQIFEYINVDCSLKNTTILPVTIAKEYHNWTGLTYNLPTNILSHAAISFPKSFNFNYSQIPDYTNVIISNIEMFSEALQYEIAINILNDCINSNRFNQTTESKDNEQWERYKNEYTTKLEGLDVFTKDGKAVKQTGILETLVHDFTNIDSVLFPKLLWGI